jgi:hypothetical protein
VPEGVSKSSQEVEAVTALLVMTLRAGETSEEGRLRRWVRYK